MDTKTARRVLREYHAAVKQAVEKIQGVDCAENYDEVGHHIATVIEPMMPQADLAVKALVERFP